MQISVITPTSERLSFLQGAYRLLAAQNYKNWEWLIYDTSLRPTTFSDPRVTYIYDEEIVSIGEKRQRLVDRAKGDVIVHFDDDDYYAPTYLERVLHSLKQADFSAIYSWFSYDLKTKQIYYWSTDERGEKHFIVNSFTGTRICEVELNAQKKMMNQHGKIGYGFSFAYTKKVARQCRFPDLDLGEDWRFYRAVQDAGFTINMIADQSGEVVHVMHDANTAAEYPQFRIPRFLVQDLLQDFFIHIRSNTTHED